MPTRSDGLDQKVARQVLTKTLRVRPGENVLIESWSEALPWAVPYVTEARKLGAHPMLMYEDEEAFWDALESGRSAATGRVGDHEWKALAETDAYVFFFGPAQWPRYAELSDKKTAGVAAYNPEWYRRAAKARLRGARMYLGRTSASAAARWKMDLDDWRTSLQRASLASPEEMHRLGSRLAARLKSGKRAKLTHPNGTSLEWRLGNFPVQLDDALVDSADLRAGNNMATIPGGVVGQAIDHTSARGTVVGNHTVYPDSGPASGLSWTFENGHLTEYRLANGRADFEKVYSAAPKKGRDRLSFVSIGLNSKLSGCPQMEDQELGSVLLRIGGNSFVGGKNPCPFGSWLVVTGGDLSIDGRPAVRRGQIV
ncbi:MAG TPA: hypothetical protein VML53_05055 [Thermoplasmata archaeon]|nr:hypothetical protein [Thermoplasmata archaeon]